MFSPEDCITTETENNKDFVVSGFDNRRTERPDIGDCKVAFATEKTL